ncbi:Fe-S oxidoreductase [Arsukibacterium sp. MJ3]|jgi:Fe-S-cluster containining protein|uniref:YkgJ family cysteine cluster protein n=1 Tax=Arsukibacterium sp. MJ3 TaxID=1632859 RepID=UPI000626F76C|nr:YkgJ family cysteine cluster protein [Arsukibacterium sp. MJ3]KKO50654.1 Fe-S oxidoreductase [Arsukibacterium sp. MJ3]
MNIEITNLALSNDTVTVTCASCQACCCRLEVMIISDTGVPKQHIAVDEWGGETMLRLDDGWCSALDRDTYRCTIYQQRPWVCREFATGSYECLTERAEQGIAS